MIKCLCFATAMSRVHHRHRARILKRDRYRCFACTKAKNLDIHHIIPQCKHGKTEDENLITLDDFCHVMLKKQIKGLVEKKLASNNSKTIAEYWSNVDKAALASEPSTVPAHANASNGKGMAK